MPTLIDLLVAVAGLFRQLRLEPLIAAALLVALAAWLARRVMAAVRTGPDDPYPGCSAAERRHAEREAAPEELEETDPAAFHQGVEEDAAWASLVAGSEAGWSEGRQSQFGDGASD